MGLPLTPSPHDPLRLGVRPICSISPARKDERPKPLGVKVTEEFPGATKTGRNKNHVWGRRGDDGARLVFDVSEKCDSYCGYEMLLTYCGGNFCRYDVIW